MTVAITVVSGCLQERIRIPDDKMEYYSNLAEMYVGDDVSPDFYGEPAIWECNEDQVWMLSCKGIGIGSRIIGAKEAYLRTLQCLASKW